MELGRKQKRVRNLSEATTNNRTGDNNNICRKSSCVQKAKTINDSNNNGSSFRSGLGCSVCGRSFSIPGSSSSSFTQLPKFWATTSSAAAETTTAEATLRCTDCSLNFSTGKAMANHRRDVHQAAKPILKKTSKKTKATSAPPSSSASNASEESAASTAAIRDATVTTTLPPSALKSKSDEGSSSSNAAKAGRRVRWKVARRLHRDWTAGERVRQYAVLGMIYSAFAYVMLSL